MEGGGGESQYGRGWERLVGAHPSLSTAPPQPLPSCIYSNVWLIYSMAVCVKNGLSYKNTKARAGMGVKTNSRGLPQECIPLPQGMTSQSK